MSISSWLCTTPKRTMLLKIVHPGGHVELHDTPLPASDIMQRNPRCCVTHPHVFKEPWAIVAPDTMLMLGHKYYVVPVNSIRKLQRLASKRSRPLMMQESITTASIKEEDESDKMECSNCLLLTKKKSQKNTAYAKCTSDTAEESTDMDLCFCNDHGLMPLLRRMKTKDNSEDMSKEMSSLSSSMGCCETQRLARTGNNGVNSRSPKRFATSFKWQPNLWSIHEDKSN